MSPLDVLSLTLGVPTRGGALVTCGRVDVHQKVQLLLMLDDVKSRPNPFGSHSHDVLASVCTLVIFRLCNFNSARLVSNVIH